MYGGSESVPYFIPFLFGKHPPSDYVQVLLNLAMCSSHNRVNCIITSYDTSNRIEQTPIPFCKGSKGFILQKGPISYVKHFASRVLVSFLGFEAYPIIYPTLSNSDLLLHSFPPMQLQVSRIPPVVVIGVISINVTTYRHSFHVKHLSSRLLSPFCHLHGRFEVSQQQQLWTAQLSVDRSI